MLLGGRKHNSEEKLVEDLSASDEGGVTQSIQLHCHYCPYQWYDPPSIPGMDIGEGREICHQLFLGT